jgi:NAD(P)-dependent dehydrogenase (short-subunit alcohol dehydrogenase family)
MSEMAGRHVVITGASSGIGRAIAVRLAGQGARVSLLARRGALLEETAGMCQPASTFVAECDVVEAAAVDRAFGEAVAAHGPVHSLVASAGAGGPNNAGEGDRFDLLVDVNVRGTYHCLRAAQRHLAPGPEARQLVVISSILGRFGVPGYTGYCASKAALLGLTRALAMEVAGDGITVNAICPGWVDTAMAWEGIEGMAKGMGVSLDAAYKQAMSAVPQGRMGRPEEVAGLVSWLLSAEAANMTGQGLDLNGGAWMG